MTETGVWKPGQLNHLGEKPNQKCHWSSHQRSQPHHRAVALGSRPGTSLGVRPINKLKVKTKDAQIIFSCGVSVFTTSKRPTDKTPLKVEVTKTHAKTSWPAVSHQTLSYLRGQVLFLNKQKDVASWSTPELSGRAPGHDHSSLGKDTRVVRHQHTLVSSMLWYVVMGVLLKSVFTVN